MTDKNAEEILAIADVILDQATKLKNDLARIYVGGRVENTAVSPALIAKLELNSRYGKEAAQNAVPDEQLEDAIARTMEDPNGFGYFVELCFEIEHFEHNDRLVSVVTDEPRTTENDGNMMTLQWRFATAADAAELVLDLLVTPIMGERSVTAIKAKPDTIEVMQNTLSYEAALGLMDEIAKQGPDDEDKQEG